MTYKWEMYETELAYLDEYQELKELVVELWGAEAAQETEEKMKIVKSIPSITAPRSEKRMKEVLDFVATGEKYCLAEYYANKSIGTEVMNYRKCVQYLKRSGVFDCDIRVHQRKDKVYLERVTD